MVTLGKATILVMPKTPPHPPPPRPPGSVVALLRMHEREVVAWWPAHRRLLGRKAGRWPRWGLGPLLFMALRLEQGCLPKGL